MRGLLGFSVILLSLFLGNLITAIAGLPIPGAVFGMLILLLLLMSGIIKLDLVEKPAALLIALMPLMFVPGGVNLMNLVSEFVPYLLPLLLILVSTTLLVIIVTGKTADWLMLFKKNKGGQRRG